MSKMHRVYAVIKPLNADLNDRALEYLFSGHFETDSA